MRLHPEVRLNQLLALTRCQFIDFIYWARATYDYYEVLVEINKSRITCDAGCSSPNMASKIKLSRFILQPQHPGQSFGQKSMKCTHSQVVPTVAYRDRQQSFTTVLLTDC